MTNLLTGNEFANASLVIRAVDKYDILIGGTNMDRCR